MTSLNVATWNLAYRNKRMRCSLLRSLMQFVCSPAMANHTPCGPGALPSGQVGGMLAGRPRTTTAEINISGPKCLVKAHTKDCLRDLDVTPAPDSRDVA